MQSTQNAVSLPEARNLANMLMEKHGLEGWTFRFNNRKRACGCCNYTRKTIELSRHMVQQNDLETIRQVTLHEIAHALAGYHAKHGPIFKAVAARIGVKGRHLDSCGDFQMPKGKYVANCCGKEYTRHRRPKRNRRTREVCPRCRKPIVWRLREPQMAAA